MTDNNELYEVIGSILKEFKAEVEESIESNKKLTSNVNIKIDIKKLDDVLAGLTGNIDDTNKENKALIKQALDLAIDAGNSAVKQDGNYQDASKSLTELISELKTLTERESDNTVASIVRQDNIEKTLESLSDKNKEDLEKHFNDTIEAIESIKIDSDSDCKEKLNAQYDSLRRDYVDLYNNVNESFKNVPRNKELLEFIATQDENIDSLKEELELQKQDNINLLAETKQYIDEMLPSLKGEKGSLERITAWQKDYPREINQVVTHNNCLWQLKYEDSNESPCDSDDWRLLIAGLTDIKISPDKENKVSVVMTDGSDKQYDCEIVLPIPNMLDTWDEHKEYKFYDNVKKDGCRWITQKDNPQGQPGESSDWHIDSLPAQRGRKGEKGEKGEIGSVGLSGHTPTKQEMITVMNEDR